MKLIKIELNRSYGYFNPDHIVALLVFNKDENQTIIVTSDGNRYISNEPKEEILKKLPEGEVQLS
jgi:hypothetical protein